MTQDFNFLTGGESITRRSFLKKGLGFGAVLLAAASAGGALVSLTGCAKPPSADLKVASTTDFNHAHNITIPGADIDSAPSQKTYTSDGATHTHAITLTKSDFQNIKKGNAVTVVSTQTGTTPHAHTWTLKMA